MFIKARIGKGVEASKQRLRLTVTQTYSKTLFLFPFTHTLYILMEELS
jgi:hypothetical protein